MTPKVTLFDAYAAQRGLFARLARRLGLDPSYISRVANGERRSKRISRAIEAELNKMYSVSWKIAKTSKRKPRLAASRKLRASRPGV
jgi:transcriptional regulator with XRE-family HTH domain